jgi:hypothetical protein
MVAATGKRLRWQHGRRGPMIALCWLTVAAATAISIETADALNLGEFGGYWTGTGLVTMTNGATEQLRCVATYKSAAQTLRQSLRCASSGYSISAAVDLKVTGAVVAGAAVAGTWEEKTYSANGDITGQMTDTGFALVIKGPTFNADLTLSHTACKQAIMIVPTGVDVTRISIDLGKC